MSRSFVTKAVRTRIRAVACVMVLTGVGCADFASADPLNAGSGAIFRMGGESAFQEGCFPPCLCPVMITAPVRGTFKLVYRGQVDGLHAYAVEDVNWLVPRDDPGLRIVGGGKYQIGSPDVTPVLQHRMELDLQVGDEPPQHFDSGWVNVESNAGLQIELSINGKYCWDRVIQVDAARVPDSEIVRYRLQTGATYQHGCFDPCDCPLEEQRPLAGEFALVSLGDTDIFRLFAVVNVRWAALSTNVNATVSITGFGLYRLGGTSIGQQRMILDLLVGDRPRARFDSGDVNAAASFPKIDVVVSMHGMVCLDTVLHIVTAPDEGDVCGGFAGIPCDEGEFCKLPVGHCCCDFFGVCMPMPDACPEVWDPVCGCDGRTYGNECEADAAGVSIAHFGECRAACGGADDAAACPEDQFCKFPAGNCGEDGAEGQCTPMPGACPRIWDPVCGCDGRTYGNECESDAAGISVRHRGLCESDDCPATRVLSDPDPSYCPGVAKPVHIVLTPPPDATAISVEDAPPPGWSVSQISHDGWFDETNGKVKWGPFFAPFPERLTYWVTPANVDADAGCFLGAVSIDGFNQAICGDRCLERRCCPLLPADLPRADCPACPVGDCTSCGDDACQDGRVGICELTGHACAWLRGCHDDMASMTRAAFIWRNGECYCWDEGAINWFPTACPAAEGGCCNVNAPSGAAATDVSTAADGSAVAKVLSHSRGRTLIANRIVTIEVTIHAPAGASSTAVDLRIPWPGAKVLEVSDGGSWDPVHEKVKWGPFFPPFPERMTVDVSRSPVKIVKPGATRITRKSPMVLQGAASFDGVNVPLTVE